MSKKNKTKFIFVTGGVCSGLGKGTSSAAIGALLKASGYSVFTLKLDPYLNVDPGTMSPYQHGEVFVTDDGTEADLDLGHYERFIDVNLSKLSNLTTGRVYQSVLNRERVGDFLGKTIQIVPHITDAIKDYILKVANITKADFLMIEIGGTVGDIEGEPYLEAARQLHNEMGNAGVMFIHVTLVPFIAASGELKTKPTQTSVRELQHRGINPDIIIARNDYQLSAGEIGKISLFCNVKKEAVIDGQTVKSIYEIPLMYEYNNHITRQIAEHFKLNYRQPKLKDWDALLKKIKDSKKTLKIGLVGKYTENNDAYLSVTEALKSACYHQNAKLNLEWIDAAKLEKHDQKEAAKMKQMDGLLIPGGFGKRGAEGKIMAAKYARENKVPYFGLCLGAQIMTIEFARNVMGIAGADSEEFNPKAKDLVVHFLPGQSEHRAKGGTLRLGSYPCILKKGTLAYQAYKINRIDERHRHRYEFNNKYRAMFEKAGLVISGDSPKHDLMEIVEIKGHPFMLGTQFHPEFKSRPLRPHPLFREFIKTCLNKKK
ncbi:MAG: CTP synthase [Candidatus Komeilibacteria bacterium]|nr:CTP synthase [Candidatus Komeilibacteria bacterium]